MWEVACMSQVKNRKEQNRIVKKNILQVTVHAHHNSVFRLTVSLVAIATLYDRKGKNPIEQETTEQNSLLSLAKQPNIA